jgi:hypothetical protein
MQEPGQRMARRGKCVGKERQVPWQGKASAEGRRHKASAEASKGKTSAKERQISRQCLSRQIESQG